MDKLYIVNNHFIDACSSNMIDGCYVFCSNNLYVYDEHKVVVFFHDIGKEVIEFSNGVSNFISHCNRAYEALLTFSKRIKYRIIYG